jgi:hypothetical protein
MILQSIATVLFFLQTNMIKFGAKSLGARPSNHHVDSQKRACWPFPKDSRVEPEKLFVKIIV